MSSPPPNSNSNSNTNQISGRKRKLPDPPGQSDNEPINTITASGKTTIAENNETNPPPAVKAKLESSTEEIVAKTASEKTESTSASSTSEVAEKAALTNNNNNNTESTPAPVTTSLTGINNDVPTSTSNPSATVAPVPIATSSTAVETTSTEVVAVNPSATSTSVTSTATTKPPPIDAPTITAVSSSVDSTNTKEEEGSASKPAPTGTSNSTAIGSQETITTKEEEMKANEIVKPEQKPQQEQQQISQHQEVKKDIKQDGDGPDDVIMVHNSGPETAVHNNNNNHDTKVADSGFQDVEMEDVEKKEQTNEDRSNQINPSVAATTAGTNVNKVDTEATAAPKTEQQNDIIPSISLEHNITSSHTDIIKNTKIYDNPKGNDKINWDTTKSILESSPQDFAQVLAILLELRDDFELLYSPEYSSALKVLVPAFVNLMKSLPSTPPQNSFLNSNIGATTDSRTISTVSGNSGIGDSTLKSKTTMAKSYIYRIRNTILVLSNLFPFNETFQPYAIQLITMAIDALRADYEENALLASKIVVELHKNYRANLVEYAEPYLDFVLMSYRSLSSNVQQNFKFKAIMQNAGAIAGASVGAAQEKSLVETGSSTTTTTSSSSSQQEHSIIIDHALKSSNSFRIVTECSLTVISIFQLYPQFIKRHLMQLLPLMMEALGQRPPPFSSANTVPTMTSTKGQEKASATASGAVVSNYPTSAATNSVPAAPEQLQQKEYQNAAKKLYMKRSIELLSAQVKTLTFVTFLLSRYGEQLKQFEDHLATNVLNLFQMCPKEAIDTRKDLLSALKHIFLTDFRKGFYKHIDLLLDDRVLVGKHKQSEHTHLRIEAYGALANFIPHVCSKMTLMQVSRVVHLYSRVLHDASMNLPLKSQMLSVNLMLVLIDPVYQNREERASLGRDILYRILENLVWKIGTFAKSHELGENFEMDEKKVQSAASDSKASDQSTDYVKTEREKQILRDSVYENSCSNRREAKENAENIIKMILGGLRKLFWCINSYKIQREKLKKDDSNPGKGSKDKKKVPIDSSLHTQQQCAWYEEMAQETINSSEQRLIGSCLVWSLKAVRIFRMKKDSTSSSTDFSKALEALSSAMSVMDTYSFQRIVGPKIDLFFDMVMEDDDAIIIFQKLLLHSASISPTFASCLIKFLMNNIKELSAGLAVSDEEANTNSERKASVMQRIFEIFFNSLSVHAKNEVELRPHLQMLIASCLRQTANSDMSRCPGTSLEILRKLFRAIAGGKFEESYKEILPLLSPLLNGLFHIFCRAKDEVLRKVIIEICLTIPARLVSLLPHLSLLIRIIIPALNTDDSDLVNLGLRTLEFWVDNLNSGFLFPVLSRDTDLFAELMLALTSHLRPAPYQYGILTVRLIGKLGGKNRLFLQEPMNMVPSKKNDGDDLHFHINCGWDTSSTFKIMLPIERSVMVLEQMAVLEYSNTQKKGVKDDLKIDETILTENLIVEKFDLCAYNENIMDKNTQNQSMSAFAILRVAFSTVLNESNSSQIVDNQYSENDLLLRLFIQQNHQSSSKTLRLICRGLFHASNVSCVRTEAVLLLNGLAMQMINLVATSLEDVSRNNNSNGEVVKEHGQKDGNDPSRKQASVVSGKLQPLLPFGCFTFSGTLKTKKHCLVLNEVITDILKSKRKNEKNFALSMMGKLIHCTKAIDEEKSTSEEKKAILDLSCADIFVENMLYHLCHTCLSSEWRERNGIFDGIIHVLKLMGKNWSTKFEVELVHVAIFCIKDHPQEVATAEKEALSFFFRLTSSLYSTLGNSEPLKHIYDHVSVPNQKESYVEEGMQKRSLGEKPVSEAICSIMIGELGSPNPAVRLAARHFLKLLYGNIGLDETNSLSIILGKHESATRRLLFSKSLRNLPLSEQIATIEAFTFIANEDSKLLPMSENLVLVFFSELLKMMSVADGEMTSESISNAVIINKDGYSPKSETRQSVCTIDSKSSLSHASGIFLRENYFLKIIGLGVIVVPPGLPIGVQFRVSSLILFHTVLKAHSDAFFEADPTSSVGNILPHIVSLLFRSLTSRPAPAVDAAHAALGDLLSLSIKNNDSTHRLSKNLLQMCIRPVLLNLRDYTKLTIPLLRGLSRLLSLLSSWFSKTLGEKLLEHLERWTDPEKIIGLGIWKRGEEPLVAAAIISLFELLPDDSSHFVEHLVKTTLRLENALPRYKSCQVESPFRAPLAKYLNRYEEATAKFFVNDHRLKTPIYSDLLQDIVKRPESDSLRKKLSDNKWSTVILNVCFERPLAIIRAEKGGGSTPGSSRSQYSNSSPRNAAEILSMHGINIDLTGQGQKSAALRQVLEDKKEKLLSATKDETKVKDRLEKLRRSESSAPPEKLEKIKRSINNAQKQLDKTQVILAAIRKEVESAKKEYQTEAAKFNRLYDRSDSREPPRSMTFDALELQHQGFCLVETLIENDSLYISEHTDVVRAFRWLWRSKGRHFRLYHEDSMPPRFNGESRVLAQFLVNFAKTSNDVDILFDLLRIFLQPTSSDFSFVQKFLKETVCTRLTIDQKKRVMQRFFPVIASEGIEELKVLSIQFLILPMLRNDFETSIDDNKVHNKGICSKSRILDDELMKTFVKEVLLHGGKSRANGCRLSIELLKLSSLLLQYMSDEMNFFHQDLIKLSWNLLKSDDVKTKQWACISICHYISSFPTPSKHILQIYAILLRSYHQDAKDLASIAMDLLLPILSRRLSSNYHTKIVQYTLKILFEEGNSIPALSHIWETIVRHEATFFEHRHRIIPHLLKSLQKLGSLNASLENKNLSLSMIELMMKWEVKKFQQRPTGDMEKYIDDLDTDFEAFVGLTSPESSPTKKVKYLPTPPLIQEFHLSFEKSDINTVTNFLVRLILLIAASDKEEQRNTNERAHKVLKTLLDRWPDAEIRSVYFDKLEAVCVEENNSHEIEKKGSAPAGIGGLSPKAPQSSNKTSQEKATASARKGDNSKSVATTLLAHCLSIFSTILERTPENPFLHLHEEKISNILTTCIHRAREKQPLLMTSLKKFFGHLFHSHSARLHHMQETCKSCLETSLIDLFGSCSKTSQDTTLYDNALFFLKLIEDLNSNVPNMIELFANTLIVIAEKISQVVVSTSTINRNSSTSFTPSIAPNASIYNHALKDRNLKEFNSVVGQKKDKNICNKSLEITSEIECMISCIRLLSKSQIPYTFTKKRERLFKIMNDILDFGSNVFLLLSAVVHIGLWLSMEKNSGPLSLKEQKSYLSKLSIIQYRNLPEIESQPLFHAIAQTVLNVVTKSDRSYVHDATDPSSHLLKPLFGCFLVADHSLRASLVHFFISHISQDIIKPGSHIECDGREQLQGSGEIRRIQTNLIGQLFSCPFDCLGNRLWTFAFVDIMLGIIKRTGKVTMQSVEESGNNHNPMIEAEGREKVTNLKLPKAFESFGNVSEYDNFLRTISMQMHDKNNFTLNGIRELATCDVDLCQELLETLLKEAWCRCSNKEKLVIIPRMEKLLASPAHSQFLKVPCSMYVSEWNREQQYQRYRDTNSVKMILRAISKLKPMPMLSIDVMMYLAKYYNCWHEVRSMMESQCEELSKFSDKLPSEIISRTQSAIRRCYSELGEHDVWMTMKVESCESTQLKWASSLDLYGLVNKAMFAYDSIIDDMEAKLASSQQIGSDDTSPVPSDIEISFVQDRWIVSQKEMCQWAALEDFADNSGCSKLTMECAWKARDWEKLRNLSSSPSIVASLESGDIDAKMSEIFLAIADGKLNEVENLHAQTAQLCLYKWQLLPQIHSGCNSHSHLLHNFHRLADIRESGHIMVETSKHAGRKTYPDLKIFLSAWRHRLPNDFDSLTVWDDIFQWRSHMYTAITTNFHWAEQGALASLHDQPWTSIKMAKIARKQNVSEVALLSLAKTDCAMDVSDAYAKLREQILSLRNGSEIERTGGLNLINTTNLEYFDSNQKGELIRLKAEFLDSLGGKTKATQAYCHAVQLCPSYAKTWISWGILCSSLADCVERQARIQASEKKLDKEKAASNAKKIVQYLAQSIGCFMEAILCESSDRARAHIPKCLQILSKDGMAPGLLCSTFQKHASKLPSWVWLTWIPQLLTSLCRIEAHASKDILLGILSIYPQSIYFSLRSFYLERRDQDRTRPATDGKVGTNIVSQAEELMSSLRKSFPSLWISLESILEELIMRFRPSYEEELLTTIIALLQRAESQIEQQVLNNAQPCDDKAVRASFSKTLSRVSAKFFRSHSDLSSSINSNDERSRRSAFFALKYKETFEKDFSLLSAGTDSVHNTEHDASLLEISTKLQKWKLILETQVSLSPPKLPLLQISPTLSAVSNCSQDLWSGACVPTHSMSKNSRVGIPDAPTQGSTAESATAAIAAAVTASRAVAMANIYEGNGGYYGTGCSSVEIPGQYSPNVSHDGKPTPELNSKLIKFESFVEISRQNDQFVRRIGMLGSDGSTYQFLLQFAVPYWTRTDERTAQLNQIFGHCLKKNKLSSRRNLWLKPTSVVPIAQRLRMTAEDKNNTSLHDIFMDYCIANLKDPNEAIELFKNECKRRKDEDEKADNGVVKLHAYGEVCKVVPDDILRITMCDRFNCAEKYYFFQRSFTSQLALNSLLQYTFDVNERSPPKLIFNCKNGHILSPDFRFSYSNQGFLNEQKPVPFRLTRNLSTFIRPNLLNGIFKPALTSAAAAISADGQNLEPALQLLSRDDIVAWYVSKSAQRDGTQRSTQDLERHLQDRIKKNVYLIQNRMRECAPRNDKDSMAIKTPIDDSVEKLMSMAMKAENQVSMPLSFCPWL